MKLIRIFLLLGFIVPVHFTGSAQGIVGSWQLVKQSSCMDETAGLNEDSLSSLREDMHSRSGAHPQVVRFKKNSSGDESSRILNQRKSANAKKFLYKFNGDMLLILDKKSQTISDSYLVDKFSHDSLIVSNASRPCETKVFVKIKEE